MFQAVAFLTERNQTEVTVFGRHVYFYTFFYQGFTFQAISNEVTDGNDFQVKTFGPFQSAEAYEPSSRLRSLSR